MNSDLNVPQEAVEYLERHSKLEYEVDSSMVGRTGLKSAGSLEITTLQFSARHCGSVDDPYELFDEIGGCYEIRVVDLIANSENYHAEGMLVWFPEKKCFGQYDVEHETVFIFRNVLWERIIVNPVQYLEHQWKETSEPLWLEFPFKLDRFDCVLPVYRDDCEIHNRKLTRHKGEQDPTSQLTILNNIDVWIQKQNSEFPFSGVPVSETHLVYCKTCRSLSNKWLRRTQKLEPAIPVKANSCGYIKCPLCNRRFPADSKQFFRNGKHTECGQKIKVIFDT